MKNQRLNSTSPLRTENAQTVKKHQGPLWTGGQLLALFQLFVEEDSTMVVSRFAWVNDLKDFVHFVDREWPSGFTMADLPAMVAGYRCRLDEEVRDSAGTCDILDVNDRAATVQVLVLKLHTHGYTPLDCGERLRIYPLSTDGPDGGV